MPQNSLIPNVTEIFLSTSGNILETLGSLQFYPQSNYANLIYIHLEDGGSENSTAFANFTPSNSRVYSSHWFYMKFEGITTRVFNGETRNFATYAMRVPNIVLANNNKDSVTTNHVTIKQVIGSAFLGSFEDLTALEIAYPATGEVSSCSLSQFETQELCELNGGTWNTVLRRTLLEVAYVIDTQSFVQIEYNPQSQIYEWAEIDLISAFTETKQYSVCDIEIQKGFSSQQGVTPIEVSTSAYIMQVVDDLTKQLFLLEETLPETYVKRDFTEYSEKTVLDEEDKFVVDTSVGTRYIKKSDLITPIEEDVDELQGEVSDIQSLFDENDPTTEKIFLKEVNLECDGSFAKIKYCNTNGNHYKVVDIEYNDGRTAQINEEIYVNYRNATGLTLLEGQVLMTDGTTQGSQAVNGFLFNENHSNAYNLLGVVTVNNIGINQKSKTTIFGIVHGINQSVFFNTGTPYDEGQVLWARDGKLSNVAPSKPALQVRMGAVINKTGPNYDVLIFPNIFQKVSDSSDVHITNSQTNDILIRDVNGKYINSQRLKLVEDNIGAINLHTEEVDGRLDVLEGDVADLKVDKADVTYVNDEVAGAKTFATNSVSNHNTSEVAHLFIRNLIQGLEREVARLDGRGKSFGEVPYTTVQMQGFDASTRATNIKNAIEAQDWFEGTYTPQNGDLVYDTGVGLGVDYHEWEYNGSAWVDNGAINSPKATNDIFGTIKGNTYLSIINGLVQVLNADLATDATHLKDAGSANKYTYQNIFDALANRYTKAEANAIWESIKLIQGVTETSLGSFNNPTTFPYASISGYDFVLASWSANSATPIENYTVYFKPSNLTQGNCIRTQIQNNPVRLGCLNHNTLGTINVGVVDNNNNVQSGFNATVRLVGFKLIDTEAKNVIYTSTNISATNAQDAIDMKATRYLDVKLQGTKSIREIIEKDQLVTNGDFSGNLNNWTVNAQVTYDSVNDRVVIDTTNAILFHSSQNFTQININDKFYLFIDGYGQSANTLRLRTMLGTNFTSDLYNFTSATLRSNTSYIFTSLGDFNRIAFARVSSNEMFYMYSTKLFNISTLIANKQYSPHYKTTFDLMTDAQIKIQMDLWVQEYQDLKTREDIPFLIEKTKELETADREIEQKIDIIEETLRKSVAGDVTGTTFGQEVIHLPKDVANGQVIPTVNGQTLQASQLVTNGDFSNGTSGWGTINGTNTIENQRLKNVNNTGLLNRTYVTIPNLSGLKIYYRTDIQYNETPPSSQAITLRNNDTFVQTVVQTQTNTNLVVYSDILTVSGTVNRFSIGSTSGVVTTYIGKTYIFNISTLIANKQYSPLFNTTFDLMTDANIKTQMDAWVQDGTLPNNEIQSVSGNKRYKAVGKNLFDGVFTGQTVGLVYTNLPPNQFSIRPTSTVGADVINLFPNIKFKENERYTISGQVQASGTNTLVRLRLRYSDNTFSNIVVPTTTLTSFTFTSLINKTVVDITFSYAGSVGEFTTYTNFMIEVGTSATTFTPYASTELYLQPNVKLNRLPNGVRDTIEQRNGKYYHVKRTEVGSNIGSERITQPINLQSGWGTLGDGSISSANTFSTTSAGGITFANAGVSGAWLMIKIKVTRTVGSGALIVRNSTNTIGQFAPTFVDNKFDVTHLVSWETATQLYLASFTASTFQIDELSIKVVSTLPNTPINSGVVYNTGSTPIYQLATPIETEIQSLGQILGGERFTVYVDSDIIAPQATLYTSNAVIANSAYPISALDTIIKLNADGSQTRLNTANATIASGGLSFTHTGLTNGDIVVFTYYYSNPNGVVGNTDIMFYDKHTVIVDTVTGTVYRWNVTSANGVPSITLTAI